MDEKKLSKGARVKKIAKRTAKVVTAPARAVYKGALITAFGAYCLFTGYPH